MDDFEIYHNRQFAQLVPKISDDPPKISLDVLRNEQWHFNPKSQQIFGKNIINPRSHNTRMYFKHATGTGKTMLGHLICNEYTRLTNINVLILGFQNTKEAFWNDALKYPELGFVTYEESRIRRELEAKFISSRNIQDYHVYNKYYIQLRGRLIHKRRGGRYTFIGYQEFANQLGFYEDNTKYDNITEHKLNKSAKYFLDSLVNTLIIADEFHQCYNRDGFNSRGIAIYFALSYHKDSIRLVATSATPFRRSMVESIYLAKLLHAGTKSDDLDIAEYFTETGELISEERIMKLYKNKVSYAPILDTSLFPRKIWATNSTALKGVDENEFRFIKCKMSKAHTQAAKEIRSRSDKFTSISVEVNSKVSKGNIYSQWIGDMYIEEIIHFDNNTYYKELELYLAKFISNMTPDIDYKKLATILPKDAQWLQDLDEMYGKIITCHPRIKGGILRLEELVRAKGWIRPNEKHSKYTPCAICNKRYNVHIKTNHEYAPSVYLILHSDLDDYTKSWVRTSFNSELNITGSLYKMIIGSEMISTGYDNKAIRHIVLLGALDSFEIIIQLYGRGIRNGSHIGLPKEEWSCMLHNYVTVDCDGDDWTPEMYQVDYHEHEGVMLVSSLIHKVAVDIIMSDTNMRIKYDKTHPASYRSDEYYMHELYSNEINTLVYVIKKLFLYQSCWKVQDLIDNIRDQTSRVKIVNGELIAISSASQIRTDIINESTIMFVIDNMLYKNSINFAQLTDHISRNNDSASLLYVLDDGLKYIMRDKTLYVIIWKDPFLLLLPINRGVIDNKLISQSTYTTIPINVGLNQLKKMLDINNPDLNIFTNYSNNLHYEVIRNLIETKSTSSLYKLYKKYGIIKDNTYSTNDQVWSYSHGIWTSKVKYNPVYNSYVGYFESEQFKIVAGKRDKLTDLRCMERGSSCKTRSLSDIIAIGTNLGIPITKIKSESRQTICELILNKFIEFQLADGANKTYFLFWGPP